MTDGTRSAPLTAAADLAADIRVFLLAEMRDYTRFTQERGDEEATRLVARFVGLAREVVEARAGKVIELRGDEALAVFGSARQALWAAAELQNRFIEETRRDPSLPLRAGIGLDAGEAKPFEGGYRGRALNLASRLKDQAQAGQVLATEAIIHIAGQVDGLNYVERGLVHPKGFSLPVRVVQIVAEGQQTSEVESPDEPELRTFLFADIRCYGAFAATQQSDSARAALETWYSEIVEERVNARGGRVLDVQGDKAFAVFVSPRQAILAAIELNEQFKQAIAVKRQLPLALGIGVEAGEAIPMRGKYTGSVVYITEGICSVAEPGEVLIGETISRLVRAMEGLRFVERGQPQIADHSNPVRIMRVVRQDAVAQEAPTRQPAEEAR